MSFFMSQYIQLYSISSLFHLHEHLPSILLPYPCRKHQEHSIPGYCWQQRKRDNAGKAKEECSHQLRFELVFTFPELSITHVLANSPLTHAFFHTEMEKRKKSGMLVPNVPFPVDGGFWCGRKNHTSGDT